MKLRMKSRAIGSLILGVALFASALWFVCPGYWNGCTVRIQRHHANELTDDVVTTISSPSKGAALAFGSKNIQWFGLETPKEGPVSLAGQWITDRWREKQMAYQFGSSRTQFTVVH